eukprot:CAMPEP_0181331366 /NCGR_PEP_ID=MMETSP1101-20121128/24457_1 /TAXON_ID=46948 /ORGANISM="Rhodomonas abbreviata, Strain Caron Lab Isolate" /LENGTH=196 /DNA_ID=CAMNT_0023440809 /DNA_START=76 /DNA_END=663 /DNA_ORIENTATION=+
MSATDDAPLPSGWSKHYSNTWKKHYWFNSKTGKQSWEPPTEDSNEAEVANAGIGEKRKHESSSNQSKPQPPAVDQGSPTKKVKPPAKASVGSAKGGGSSSGGLGSILSSITTATSAGNSAAALEARRRRKEAEENKRAEEKAERDNYTAWVQSAIEGFLESGEEVYEFPPSDSMHRLIAKDEAEVKGLVAFSHGDD